MKTNTSVVLDFESINLNLNKIMFKGDKVKNLFSHIFIETTAKDYDLDYDIIESVYIKHCKDDTVNNEFYEELESIIKERGNLHV